MFGAYLGVCGTCPTGCPLLEAMVTQKRIRAVPAIPVPDPSTNLVPIAEASARLRLSESAIRRQLKAGRLVGERRPMPQGFQWFIRLEPSTPMPTEVTDGEAPVVRSRRRAVATPAPVIDLEAIRADHLAELARLEASHAGEVGSLRDAIAILRAEHADAFTRLEAAHLDAFTRLETVHGETIEVLRTTHAGEVDAIRRELATASAWANRSWWRWLLGLPPA